MARPFEQQSAGYGAEVISFNEQPEQQQTGAPVRTETVHAIVDVLRFGATDAEVASRLMDEGVSIKELRTYFEQRHEN